MKEFNTLGPPGTGKTTWLVTKVIPQVVKKYGPEKVMLTSFSKAAAKELAGRIEKEGLTVDDRKVGTLHSICFHALGCPPLVAGKIKLWNEQYPDLALGNQQIGSMDEAISPSGSANGSAAMARVELLRAKMTPMQNWPASAKSFYKKWMDFKRETGTVDFTDLIETCLRDRPYAPGNPDILIMDEAQDANPLMLAITRSWGRQMRSFILVGDDDQTIFGFNGASPDVFLNSGVDPANKQVLGQSYRVPRAVWAAAMQIVGEIQNREPKEYQPKKDKGTGKVVEGNVRRLMASWKKPQAAIEDAKIQIQNGKDVMFLASCSYMIEPLKNALKDAGLPFWNKYRKRRGDWNPLLPGEDGKVSARDLLVSFNERGIDENFWNVPNFIRWAKYLKTGDTGLVRGRGKKGLKALEQAVDDAQEGLHTTRNVLSAILSPQAIEPALRRDTQWLIDNLQKTRVKALEYPLKVFNLRGQGALVDEPQITIGTIHSVKGGESDCHPGDEKILVANGPSGPKQVEIKDLDENKHRLVSFNLRNSKINKGTRLRKNGEYGYQFKKASRPYAGKLFRFETTRSNTRVTPNHHMLVRFNKNAKGKYVVYLMKKGSWWRVGQCKLIHEVERKEQNTIFGLGNRVIHERADAAWILSVHDNLHDSLANEIKLSTQFGLPRIVFKTVGKSLPQPVLDGIFNSFYGMDKRAKKILQACGRDIRWPFYERNGRIARTGRNYSFIVQASNFLPGLMKIPIDNGTNVAKWTTPQVSTEEYQGRVYSLDVLPHHYYIAGGAVVHNCIYVSPDFSYQAYKELWTGVGHRGGTDAWDAMHRLFYVAVTRAKEEVVVMSPAKPDSDPRRRMYYFMENLVPETQKKAA